MEEDYLGGKFIFNTTKEFPNMIKINIYREPYYLPDPSNRMPAVKRKTVDEDWQTATRSLARTKTLIHDIALCNDFEYFCTFTFDPEKYDRYNFTECRVVMDRWLWNAKTNHSPDLKYLAVPEFHRDGAIHFHALISGYKQKLKATKVQQNGRLVYNIGGYRAGFSTAVKIDNQEAVAKYITKYITKDMPTYYNKRRFFASRNLIRPIKTTNNKFIHLDLPLLKKHIYSTPYLDSYELY